MNAKELRDRMVEKRTLYQNALKESDQAKTEIQQILDSFDNETLELLISNGFNIGKVTRVNLDELQQNSDALVDYRSEVENLVEQLREFLEEELK